MCLGLACILSFFHNGEGEKPRSTCDPEHSGRSTLHTEDSSQFLKLSLVVEGSCLGGRGSRARMQQEEDISTSIS